MMKIEAARPLSFRIINILYNEKKLNCKGDIKMVWVIMLTVVAFGTAIWNYFLCDKEEKLVAEIKKLKAMNAGQKEAIEELQDKNWLLQDILEMERGA